MEGEDHFIGRTLAGRYKVLGVLGEGGMGRVYVAEQAMGRAVRKVAIKTLLRELSQYPEVVARFQLKCETVVQLTHPNTIQFFDFGQLDDGTLYVVMEYLEGGTLEQELQRGPLASDRIDRILAQVCGALDEAHQRGIVHRDLKPANVHLGVRAGQSDFVKVLDWGIARQSEADWRTVAKLTAEGAWVGTPPYMSPEQFDGAQLDGRSDVYSLGVMLYELHTGDLPIVANTALEFAIAHKTLPPRPLASHPLGSRLPAARQAALMRALSKRRGERQYTVRELLRDVTGADAGTTAPQAPIQAGPPRVQKTIPEGPPLAAMTPAPQPVHATAMAPPLHGSTQVAGWGGWAAGQQPYVAAGQPALAGSHWQAPGVAPEPEPRGCVRTVVLVLLVVGLLGGGALAAAYALDADVRASIDAWVADAYAAVAQ